MKVVVDTNVIAYRLLRSEPFFAEVREFWDRVSEPIAPASWQAELANTIWMAVRQTDLSQEDGLQHLRDVELLGIGSVDVSDLWEAAFEKAVKHDHPAYDTLFVQLAAREDVPLATFDGGLLSKFPGVAKRPKDLLAAV